MYCVIHCIISSITVIGQLFHVVVFFGNSDIKKT